MTKLTVKQATRRAEALGFTLRKTGFDDELRLCRHGGSEAVAYYTDDPDDAVATAEYDLTHEQESAS